jgi:hypothetical protein
MRELVMGELTPLIISCTWRALGNAIALQHGPRVLKFAIDSLHLVKMSKIGWLPVDYASEAGTMLFP